MNAVEGVVFEEVVIDPPNQTQNHHNQRVQEKTCIKKMTVISMTACVLIGTEHESMITQILIPIKIHVSQLEWNRNP